MLSKIALSDWKAHWDSEITCGRRLFSLLAKTLDISLYRTLHRAIGLNLETLLGLFTFGMRVM